MYIIQNQQMVLGSKSSTNVLSGVTLQSTYNVSGIVDCAGFERIALDALYTTGSGETSNSIELKIEFSPDGTNWYRAVNDTSSAGTSTLTQREFTFVGTLAATGYYFDLPLTVQNKKLKISAKETDVSSTFGTVSIEITMSG